MIKDRNSTIIKDGGSTIRSTATVKETAYAAVKEDTTGNGREYVKSSLDSSVKEQVIKSYDHKAPSSETPEPHRQRSYTASRQNQEQSGGQSYSRNQEQQRQQSDNGHGRTSTSEQGSSPIRVVTQPEPERRSRSYSSTHQEKREEQRNERYSSGTENQRYGYGSRMESGHKGIQRVHSEPEQSIGSNILSGAAATATYVSTTEKVIKDSAVGVEKTFVRSSLESSVKENLIRNPGSPAGSAAAVTQTEKAAAKIKAAKGTGDTPSGEGLSSSTGKGGKKSKGFGMKAADHAYNGVVALTAQSGRDGGTGERTVGQSVKHMVRTPRYVKSAAGVMVSAERNVRYASKLYKEVKAGLLTGKEAGLALLKRGGKGLSTSGLSATGTVGMAVEEFYGSEDLGVEAVRKPKDAIIATSRTLKVSSRVASSIAKTPQNLKRSLRDLQKTAQKAQQLAKYAATGVRSAFKALSNPAAIKSLVIVLAIGAAIVVLMAGVSSISSLFSSFTYPANDVDLTDAWSYVTELDTELADEIAHIEENHPGIDVFHINAFEPRTDPMPIVSYLSVRYEDFKFNNVRAEIQSIHRVMYHLRYHQWTETIRHHSSGTNSDGSHWSDTWYEYIEHLDVDLDYKPFSEYVEEHKAEMFPKTDDYARYETYNRIGGTRLRSELGFPFPGKTVYVSSRFGWRLDPVSNSPSFHGGIDIPMNEGTPISATMGGRVSTGYDGNGYGKYVVVTSGNRKTLYGHCSSISVSNGQTVQQGQVIAAVGNTGKSTGSHLHLEFEKAGKKLNPLYYVEFEQFISGLNGGLAGEGLGAGDFAALIAEAEKYLGFPYVFGGRTPATSFDCSGFVSWVLTHSGVKSISTTAQGLYNNCTPINESEVQPGDLIFFEGTYDCPNTVTHVGFYISDGIMLHCGNPIQYTSYNTSYWRSHFYSFGRINK